jgi:hypothetical protein
VIFQRIAGSSFRERRASKRMRRRSVVVFTCVVQRAVAAAVPAVSLVALLACATLRAPTAPGGKVQTSQGGAVELADLFAERPLVVVFYRGFW